MMIDEQNKAERFLDKISESHRFRPTQVGTAIAVVTVATLIGMTAYKGNMVAVTEETRESQEQTRAKNQVTIAKEIISNGKQYPSYDLSPELGDRVPELEKSRLTSFRSSRTGFYYSIARLDGHMQIMNIFSRKEIQTTIDLIQQEKQRENS